MSEPDERARVLVVDDDERVARLVGRTLEGVGYDVDLALTGSQAEGLFQDAGYDVVFLDLSLPDASGLDLLSRFRSIDEGATLVMLSGTTVIGQAVEAMKRGAFDFVPKPFVVADLEKVAKKAVRHSALRSENARLRRLQDHQSYAGPIFAESPTMRRLLATAERVAATSSPVMIVGETGSGKGLVAKAVHRASPRSGNAMVHINCGALPEQLVESELFGHERGAFTGAQQQKMGLFEVATGSSLFLDEIGELPLASQAKLLQVLDTGELRRVGGTRVHRVDARILAATNRDLAALVAAGKFREDLLFRLNVVELRVPPLRERREDLEALVDHYLDKRSTPERAPRLSEEARAALMGYPWPGNVRELSHVIERACVLARGEAIYPEDLRLQTHAPVTAGRSREVEPVAPLALKEVEKTHIESVLEHTGGNRSQAARLLAIDVKTLRKKIRDYEL